MNVPKITDVLSYFNIDAHDCVLEDCVWNISLIF